MASSVLAKLKAWAKNIPGPRVTEHLDPCVEDLPVQWCDYSDRDQRAQGRLTKRKRDAERVADILEGIGDPRSFKAAEAMRTCGDRVRLLVDADTGEVISRAICCRCNGRWCPVCVWQRALTWRRRTMDAVAEIEKLWPDTRWLLLTLTTRNVSPFEVRRQVKKMYAAFGRMVKRKRWPGVGYIRALEVTRGRGGTAHVHFHALVMVPGSYFRDSTYLAQKDYVELWREALRVDYKPLVYVQAVKAERLAPSAVGEALKYPIKLTRAALDDADWLGAVVGGLWNVRALAAGGLCRVGLVAARRIEAEKRIERAKDLEGRRVVVRWFRWNGVDYVPPPGETADAWTVQLRARWAGVETSKQAA